VAVSPAKTAEPIELLFEVLTRVDPRNHVLDRVHVSATWRIRLNSPCSAVMRAVYQLAIVLPASTALSVKQRSRVCLSVCLSHLLFNVNTLQLGHCPMTAPRMASSITVTFNCKVTIGW